MLIAIPVILAATFLWQVASNVFHTDVTVRQAVAVGQVTLEADPAGARVDFVLVDRVGKETTFNGNLTVKVREPNGTVWQTTRSVSADDFQALPDGSLLAGRVGYSVVVPASNWARPPRQGGLTTITVSANPGEDGGTPFSADSQQRFP